MNWIELSLSLLYFLPFPPSSSFYYFLPSLAYTLIRFFISSIWSSPTSLPSGRVKDRFLCCENSVFGCSLALWRSMSLSKSYTCLKNRLYFLLSFPWDTWWRWRSFHRAATIYHYSPPSKRRGCCSCSWTNSIEEELLLWALAPPALPRSSWAETGLSCHLSEDRATFLLFLLLDQRDQFEGSGWRHFAVLLSLEIHFGFRVLLPSRLGIVWGGLEQFVKKLLRVRTHLGSRAGAHVLLDLFPIFPVLHDCCIGQKLPYMNRWCYSLLHRPDERPYSTD